MGAELELMLIKRTRDGKLLLPTDYENFRLTESITQTGASAGDALGPGDFSNEPPACMIELKTKPHTLGQLHHITGQMDANKAVLAYKAANLAIPQEELDAMRGRIAAEKSEMVLPDRPLYPGELLLCPFAVLPFAKRDRLLANIISPRGAGASYTDRPRLMMRSFRAIMSPKAVSYPVSNSAVHVTHGTHSRQHAFEMSRLLCGMMPFLFVFTENRPPYQNGSFRRQMKHTGIMARVTMNIRTEFNRVSRGLYPEFVWTAKNADEFVDDMLKTYLDAPMLAYWNNEGKFTPAERGEQLRPAAMQGKGPENVSQFELAMSQFWWCFKYKLHPKEPGAILHELRDFDSGPATVNNVSLLMGMFSLNDGARAQILDTLDRKYGIPLMRDPQAARAVVYRNTRDALHRGDTARHPECGGRHMQTPFGAHGHTMLDFLREDLMPLLERQYKGTASERNLGTIRFIAATGMTDTQLWYDCFASQEEQARALLAMTEDVKAYNDLLHQGKSWAQLHAEGRLPWLERRPG
jgi:hypothetical protein